jgi:hypothetical protein
MSTASDSMPLLRQAITQRAVALMMVLGACAAHEAPATSDTASSNKMPISEAGDTCAKLDTAARRQATTEIAPLPPRQAGAWTVTRKVTLDAFSLEIPVVARARSRDAHGVYWVDSLPRCRFFCALEITFARDSTTRSLESYIAARRMIDTTANPDAADWQPQPPHYVTLGGKRAALMETTCGDCVSGEVLFFRSGQVARLAWSTDDREGFQPGLVCRLQRMAGTFEWGSTTQ